MIAECYLTFIQDIYFTGIIIENDLSIQTYIYSALVIYSFASNQSNCCFFSPIHYKKLIPN